MKKIKKFREKGITLVALVITIIILLILAGVTINTALSENGLFRMAKKAVNEYQESEKQEQTALDSISEEMEKISIDYNDYVGAYVTGYYPKTRIKDDPYTIGINTSGHTQAQDFITEEGIKWRIWDYNKYTKTIRLISSKPTDTKLTLNNATGYNNGVWAINEICRQCYGSDKKGVTVANLKRSDIQKVSTYDYTNYKHKPDEWEENQTEGTVYFGSSKPYDNHKYPKIWEEYDSKWSYGYDGTTKTGSDQECETWEKEYGYAKITETVTESGIKNFKQSFYAHDYINKQAEFINEEYYNLLFKNENGDGYLNKAYWLAGRYVQLYENICDFGLQNVGATDSNCYVNGTSLYRSIR